MDEETVDDAMNDDDGACVGRADLKQSTCEMLWRFYMDIYNLFYRERRRNSRKSELNKWNSGRKIFSKIAWALIGGGAY